MQGGCRLALVVYAAHHLFLVNSVLFDSSIDIHNITRTQASEMSHEIYTSRPEYWWTMNRWARFVELAIVALIVFLVIAILLPRMGGLFVR